ncbi:MAG: CRISPR-associated endonuclease Cas2 [Desulfobacterales bacterium]|nr:MAG: CRISPR-associated endonuclease Cas2 [Desulfobacterales bacterium]
MVYFIIYDIADCKRLNRVAKILKDYGVRIQKSKFETDLSGSDFRRLQVDIGKIIDPAEDGVKFFPLCASCAAKTEIIGKGMLIETSGAFDII